MNKTAHKPAAPQPKVTKPKRGPKGKIGVAQPKIPAGLLPAVQMPNCGGRKK